MRACRFQFPFLISALFCHPLFEYFVNPFQSLRVEVSANRLLQYVKMIHNGIEHGMMSAQSEAWQIMNLCLGMSYDEIGEEFARWNADGELVRNHRILINLAETSYNVGRKGRFWSILELRSTSNETIKGSMSSRWWKIKSSKILMVAKEQGYIHRSLRYSCTDWSF